MASWRILTIVVGLVCLIPIRIATAVSDKVPNNNNKINKPILGGTTSRFVVGGATIATPQQPQQEDARIHNFNHPDNNSKNNNENGVDSDDDAIFVRKSDGRLEALDGSKVRFWARVMSFSWKTRTNPREHIILGQQKNHADREGTMLVEMEGVIVLQS
jgi:hypothetical protein